MPPEITPTKLAHYSALERLAARVEILRRHDSAMWTARYDYGAGQRARELRRVNSELRERCHFVGADEHDLIDSLSPALLLAAFEKVAVPRMRRMSSSRRGAWLRVLRGIADAGAELVPDRAAIEADNGYPLHVEVAVELWCDQNRV